METTGGVSSEQIVRCMLLPACLRGLKVINGAVESGCAWSSSSRSNQESCIFNATMDAMREQGKHHSTLSCGAGGAVEQLPQAKDTAVGEFVDLMCDSEIVIQIGIGSDNLDHMMPESDTWFGSQIVTQSLRGWLQMNSVTSGRVPSVGDVSQI